jgi:hypothetical protein
MPAPWWAAALLALGHLLPSSSSAPAVGSESPPVVYAAVIANASAPNNVTIATASSPEPLSSLSALAWGSFNDSIAENGWSFLDVTTNASVADTQSAAAAGYLEGYLTAQRTFEFIMNVHGGSTIFSPALLAYVTENLAWVHSQFGRGESDPLWYHFALTYAHHEGMWKGYTDAAAALGLQAFPYLVYYSATLIGDLDDLCVAFGCNRTVETRERAARGEAPLPSSPLPFSRSRFTDGHCSVLVKAIPGPEGTYTELFAGHTTWNPLETLTRTWKSYTFPFALDGSAASQARKVEALGGPEAYVDGGRGPAQAVPVDLAGAAAAPAASPAASPTSRLPGYSARALRAAVASGSVVPGVTQVFSSYPGVAYSFDDLYLTFPSRLFVTETTIINNNMSLYTDFVRPEGQVLDWVRNMAANRLAHDGASWMDWYGTYVSGTYNNEFTVVTYPLFEPGTVAVGSPLPAGLVWVGEQMPGVWVAEDRTSWLTGPSSQGNQNSYLASFNRPSFPEVYNISGQWALLEQYGPHFSFADTARANIFRRGAPAVQTPADYAALLRYNDFENDPLATQACTAGSSASNAIAERGDLTPVDGSSACCDACGLTRHDEAAIDLKFTTAALMLATGGSGGGSGDGTTVAAYIQSGLTTNGGTLPPFRWSTSPFNATVPHAGMPDLFDFPLLLVTHS